MSAEPRFVVLIPVDSETSARTSVTFAVLMAIAVTATIAVVVSFPGGGYTEPITTTVVTTAKSPKPIPPPCYPFADCGPASPEHTTPR